MGLSSVSITVLALPLTFLIYSTTLASQVWLHSCQIVISIAMDLSVLLTGTRVSILSPQASVRPGPSKCQTTPVLPSGVQQATSATNLDANVRNAMLPAILVLAPKLKIVQFAQLECSST